MPTTTASATWRRIRSTGEWGVAVPATSVESRLLHGQTVTVTKRDGTTSTVILGGYVETATGPSFRDGIARYVYRVGHDAPTNTAPAPLTHREGLRSPSPAAERPSVPEGTHVLNGDTVDPTIYRVTRSRRGYLVAHRLDTMLRTRSGRARWIYIGIRPLASLTPETLLTEAQARQIGARLGFCANCGRALTADESVDRGIGPVCFRRIRSRRLAAARATFAPCDREQTRAELAERIDRARRAAESAERYDNSDYDPDDNEDPDDDAAQAALVTA